MRTPAGTECRHYFQDFHRGKNVQECRLVKDNPASKRWKPTDCVGCPIPAILQANASPHLELTLTIGTRLLGLGRQLTVKARCTRHNLVVEDPFVGCAQCNRERPGLDLFLNALEGTDEAATD
ncbi:MAG TPA: hypothetical protein VER79_08895 [Candidatus Limnocylindrales bacterium]|nr:hypothetical protein [Candidatus Limnocylindrales bacterium]